MMMIMSLSGQLGLVGTLFDDDHKLVWPTLAIGLFGAYNGFREGDSKEWSTVLVTALGSWGKPVPRGHPLNDDHDDGDDEYVLNP